MPFEEILHHITDLVQARYRGLSPEAIIAFLIIASEEPIRLGALAQALKQAEPTSFLHVRSLSEGVGAGLVHIAAGDMTGAENDGNSLLSLSVTGQTLASEIASKLLEKSV